MKDQYFGDFGDYQKISLLQILKNQGLNITTYWMKTADDGSTDGKHITYLNKPLLWRSYEPEIFDFLNEKITQNKRLLSHIETSRYCKGIEFLNNNIELPEDRDEVFKKLLINRSNLIFFDPDNGIEVKSTTSKNSHKYVLWKEITSVYQSKKSILIYQHFSRSNRDKFIREKLAELKNKINAYVVALKVKHSVYFFVLHKKDIPNVSKALSVYSKTWHDLSRIYEPEKITIKE